jgi:hypothetical protein
MQPPNPPEKGRWSMTSHMQEIPRVRVGRALAMKFRIILRRGAVWRAVHENHRENDHGSGGAEAERFRAAICMPLF